MAKRYIVIAVLLSMLLACAVPVSAKELTALKFKIQLDKSQRKSEPGYLLREWLENHDFYLIINNEYIQIRLSATETDKLSRGEKITFELPTAHESIGDGEYVLSLQHGTTGQVDDYIEIKVEDGDIEYTKVYSTFPKTYQDTIFLIANKGSPTKGQPLTGTESDDWEDRNISIMTYWGDIQPDNSMLAGLLSKVLQKFMLVQFRSFGLHDPVTLFFGLNPKLVHPLEDEEVFDLDNLDKSLYVEPEEAHLYMFTDKEANLINEFYTKLESLIKGPYVLAIIIIGFLLFAQGAIADERSSIKMLVQGIFLFPILLWLFPYVLEPLFWLNDVIVRTAGSFLMTDKLQLHANPLTRPFVTLMIGSGIKTGALGVLFGTFCLLLLVAILNFQYYVRRFTLALLLIMFPLIAFQQIFPGKKETLALWWAELKANLFLQSAHALVYAFFIKLIYDLRLPFVPVMAMLASLASLTIFVRNLMGCKSYMGGGVVGTLGGILGLRAIMGAGRIASRALGRAGTRYRYSQDEPERARQEPETHGLPEEESSELPDEPEGMGGEPTGPAAALGATPPSRHTGTEAPNAMWGLRPRVETIPVLGTVGRAAAGVGVATMSLQGAMIGGAALGPAGAGLGAMAGTRVGSSAASVAGYGTVVAGNYVSRQKILSSIKRQNPELSTQEAAILASTGVRATWEEIQHDDVMKEQYMNFVSVAGLRGPEALFQKAVVGFQKATGIMPKRLAPEEARELRFAAADEREYILNKAPNISPQELNEHVLTSVIRPALYFKDDNGGGGDSGGNNDDNGGPRESPTIPQNLPEHTKT